MPNTFVDGTMYGPGIDMTRDETLVAIVTRAVPKKRKRGNSVSTRVSKSVRRSKRDSPPRDIDDVYSPFEAPYEVPEDNNDVEEAPYSPSYVGGGASGPRPDAAAAVAAPLGGAASTMADSGAVGVDLGSIESLLASLNQRATVPPPPANAVPVHAQGGTAPIVQHHAGSLHQPYQQGYAQPHGRPGTFDRPPHTHQPGHRVVHGAAPHRDPNGGYRAPGPGYGNAHPPPGGPGYSAGPRGYPPRGPPPQHGQPGGFTQRQYTPY
jgi:hypothetical protein